MKLDLISRRNIIAEVIRDLKYKDEYLKDYHLWGCILENPITSKRWLRFLTNKFKHCIDRNSFCISHDLYMLAHQEISFVDIYQLRGDLEYIELLLYSMVLVVSHRWANYDVDHVAHFQFSANSTWLILRNSNVVAAILCRPSLKIVDIISTLSVSFPQTAMQDLQAQFDIGQVFSTLYDRTTGFLGDFSADVIKNMMLSLKVSAADAFEDYFRTVGPHFCVIYLTVYLPDIILYHTKKEGERPPVLGYLGCAVAIAYLINDCEALHPVVQIINMIKNSVLAIMPQMDLVDSLTTVISVWVSTRHGVKFDASFIKNLGVIGNSKKGLNELVEAVVRLTKEIVNYVSHASGYGSYFVSDKSGSFELDSYLNKHDVLVHEFNSGRLIYDPANMIRVTMLMKDGDSLLRSNIFKNMSSGFTIVVREAQQRIYKIYEKFVNANVDDTGLRFETILLMFCGPPGRCKSNVLKSVADHGVMISGTEEQRKLHRKNDRTFICNRQPENKYWEGYSPNTLVITFDDYGQMKQSEANATGDGESMAMIRISNVFPMEMHCAGIEKKGVLRCNAMFGVATTNLKRLDPEDIVSPAALKRRIKLIFTTFKPRYLHINKDGTRHWWSEKPNWKTIREDFGVDIADDDPLAEIKLKVLDLNTNLWEFHYMTAEGVIDSTPRSYEDIQQYMESTYLERMMHYLNNQKSFRRQNNESEDRLDSSGFYDKVEALKREIKSDREMFAEADKEFFAMRNIVPQMDISLPGSWIKVVQSEDTSFSEMEQSTSRPLARPPLGRDEGYSQPVNWKFRVNQVDDEVYVSKGKTPLEKFLASNFDKRGIIITSNPSDEIVRHMDTLTPQELSFIATRLKESVDISNVLDAAQLLAINSFLSTGLTTLAMTGVAGTVDQVAVLRRCLACIFTAWSRHRDWLESLCDINKELLPVPSIKLYRMQPFKLCTDSIISMVKKAVETAPHIVRVTYEGLKKGKDLVMKHPIISLVGGLSMMYGAFQMLTGASPDDGLVFQSADNVYVPRKTKRISKIKTLAEMKANIPQMLDSMGEDLCRSVTRTNSFSLCFKQESGGQNGYKIMGNILALKGHICVMNHHYLMLFHEEMLNDPHYYEKIIYFVKQGKALYGMSVGQFFGLFNNQDLVDADQDLVFFTLPREMPLFKDITNKFVKADVASSLGNFRVYSHSLKRDVMGLYTANLKSGKNVAPKVQINDEGYNYILFSRIEYDAPTQAGDCGNVIVAAVPRLGDRRLIGIHSCGSQVTNKAYASAMTYEYVMEMISVLETDVLQPQMLVQPDEIPSLYDSMIYSGEHPDLHHKIGLTHSRIPSPLQSEIQPSKYLSRLRPEGNNSPLKNSLSKFHKSQLPAYLGKHEEHALAYAIESLDMLVSRMKFTDKRILTLKEALWGSEMDEYISSLNGASSAGAWFKKYHPKLKDQLFGVDAVRDENNPGFPLISQIVDEWIQMLKTGVVPNDYYTANLKAELVSKDKWENYKSRLFMGGSFISMIVFNMYFGSFRATYLENRIQNESSLGINPFSTEWTQLAVYMTQFVQSTDGSGEGEAMVQDADFKGFDTSHSKRILWIIFDRIQNWYDDGFSDIRRLLWRTMVDCNVIHQSSIFNLPIGMPSGNFLTSVINTMINQFIFRYAFCRYLQDNDLCEVEFTEHVAFSAHGDDNFWNTDQYQFNGDTVSRYMDEIGYTITGSDKGAMTSVWKTLGDIDYLKRKFKYEKLLGCFIAPITKDTITEIPLWVSKKDPDAIFVSNLETSIREMSLHSPEEYVAYYKYLVRHLQKVAPDVITFIPFISRPSMLARIYLNDK